MIDVIKSGSGDAIQLAAYVVIFVVMGLVTLFKKMAEAQRRRAAEEARAAKQRQPTIGKGLRPDKPAPTITPESLPPVMTQPYAQPAEEPFIEDEEEGEEEKEGIEIKDVLRKALGLPSSERRPPEPVTIRPKPVVSEKTITPPARGGSEKSLQGRPRRQQEPTAEPSLEPAVVTEHHWEPDRVARKQGWSNFLNNLEAKELHQLQQAIIFSEIINPPIALRRDRRINSFWPR